MTHPYERHMRSQYADDLTSRWIEHMGLRAHQAYRHDPTYHAIVKLLRNLLIHADMAMEDENVDPETRRRVLHSIVYGAMPDPDDGLQRIEMLKDAAVPTWIGAGLIDPPAPQTPGGLR